MKFLILCALLFVTTYAGGCSHVFEDHCSDISRKCSDNLCGSCLVGHIEPKSVEAEAQVGKFKRNPEISKTITLDGSAEENCMLMSQHMKKCEPFDATFIMDGSGSICGDGKDAVDENGECDNFNNLETFVKQVIDSSTQPMMKSALIQFANYAIMHIRLGQVLGKENLKSLIEKRFQYPEGRTNMEDAMRMYLDEVLPHHVDDPTMHNIYLLTDGIPTDDPCSLADEWNERTSPYNINTFVVLVKDWRGAKTLSCLDATFIKVKDFKALECPDCVSTRAECSEYKCPTGLTHRRGKRFCVDADCKSDSNRAVCCEADMCHRTNKCKDYDATFIVDSSGSICTKRMPRDADGECENFNNMENFVAQSIAGSTKEDMLVGMIRFAGTPYLRRRWRVLKEETDAEISLMVNQKLKWYGGRTDMGEALDLYDKKLYNDWDSTKYPGRSYKGWKGNTDPHNLYFITDGEPTDDVCSRAERFNKMVKPEHINAFIVIVGQKDENANKIEKKLGCLDAEIMQVHNFADLQCAGCDDDCTSGPDGRDCENMGVLAKQDGKCVCDCTGLNFVGAWCELEKPCSVGINGKECLNGGSPTGIGEQCSCECPVDDEGPLYVGSNCEYHRTEVLWVTAGTFSGAGKFFHFLDTEADRLTGMKRWYKHEWNILTSAGRQGVIKIYKNSRSCDECGRYRDTPTVNDFTQEKWIYLKDHVVNFPEMNSCVSKSQGAATALQRALEAELSEEDAFEEDDDQDVAVADESEYEAELAAAEGDSNTTTYLMYAAACVFALGAGFHYGNKQ